MNKEWWCEKFDEICIEMYDCEPWELTPIQRIQFNLIAHELIASRYGDLIDRTKDARQ